MLFTKDKKRPAPADPKKKRPAAPEAPRKRPAEKADQAAPQRRRPAEEPRQAAPQRRRPAEEPRQAAPRQRRPAEDPRQAAPQRRRPAEEPRQAAPQRRRPAEEPRQAAPQRRRPAEEPRQAAPQRRRPAEAETPRRRAPEQPERATEAPVTQVPETQDPSLDALLREAETMAQQGPAEEKVFKIAQQPRVTPATSRTPRPRKPAKPRRADGKSEPPQGTSYHRSTPKQKKTLRDLFIKEGSTFYKDPDQQAAAARARKAAREEKKQKIKKLAKKFDTPAIVYTDPKPFNRNRFLIQLISVLAVACAFVMGLSIFFKVETITVSGAETYSASTIQEASGIKKGDYLLTFGRARASGQITANLPYINSVRIGIKLPNTVNIDVDEADVAYAIKSGDGDWWLITSEGKVVKQIPGPEARNYTQILGVKLDNPVVNQLAAALEEVPEADAAPGETGGEATEETKEEENSLLEPPITVSGTMRLKAALRILVALEENDIVGEAATVNVENLQKIELWYGQQYQVSLGSAEQLEYKVACMYDAILQMSDYQNGMLDVSFEKKKDQVVYTPFV